MRIANRKLITLAVTAALFAFFGYYIGSNNTKSNSKNIVGTVTKQPDVKASFLGSGIQFKNFLVHFDKDQALVTSFEGQPNWPGGYIKATDYPNLFKAEGGGTFFLTAKEINDKVNNKQFVYISKQVFNHGAYSDVYGLIFDPSTGKVVYETPKELAMSSLAFVEFLNNDSVIKVESYPYYFYASCTACKLGIIDYSTYDPKQAKFIPVNNKFKSDFEKLLADYDLTAKEKCSYNGKVIAVNEIEKIAGKDAKCDDMSFPAEPKKAPNDYITVGQFQELRDKINGVISGNVTTLLSSN